MVPSRFSLLFLAAWLPSLALAAVPTVQEASQAFRQGNNAVALDKVNSYLSARIHFGFQLPLGPPRSYLLPGESLALVNERGV